MAIGDVFRALGLTSKGHRLCRERARITVLRFDDVFRVVVIGWHCAFGSEISLHRGH